MICYQDEMLHCKLDEDITAEELQAHIEKLEMELYGRTYPKDYGQDVKRKPMIYDVKLGKLVERV